MRDLYLRVVTLALCGAALLVACHGTSALNPSTAAYSQPPNGFGPASLRTRLVSPDKLPPCKAKHDVPTGTYISIASIGEVKNGTYTGDPANSTWETILYTRATAPPTTTPSPSPTPVAMPEYLYYGEYSVRRGKALHPWRGCAYLLTTKTGKPFKGLDYNAQAYGHPNIIAPYYDESVVKSGPLSISISGIAKNSGIGTIVLKNASGKSINSGSVRLTGRILMRP